MIAVLSVAYAMQCAERDAWIEAAEAYRTTRGAAHVEARAVWWPMVRAERERLRLSRLVLMAAAREAALRRMGT